MSVLLRTYGVQIGKKDKDFHQQKTSSKSSMITKGSSNIGGGGEALTSDTRIQIKKLSQGSPSPKETVEMAAIGSDSVSESK